VDEAVVNNIAWLLKIMKERFGEDAYQVLVKARGEMICSQWSKIAEEAGDNSIETLIKHLFEPLREEGFEYSIEETDSGFDPYSQAGAEHNRPCLFFATVI